MSGLNPKWLIGRTIVAVEMNAYRARESPVDRTLAHQPVITLDNGARLLFITDETDFGEYGTTIVYAKPRKPAARKKEPR